MKNIILIVVDQMRYDCLSHNGNPQISTPNLDMLASLGVNFSNCYSAVPTCIASRAALMTGLKQKNHKRVGYEDGVPWLYSQTLASAFTSKGYQTEAIGKMHVFPDRNRIGFEHVLLHDGYLHHNRKFDKSIQDSNHKSDDYLTWLKEKKGGTSDIIDSGIGCNSWVVKPWLFEEELHPSNWVTKNGINFMSTRDTTKPYFLMLSYVRPHSPLDPPNYYYDMYKEEKIQYPIGEWAENENKDKRTDSTKSVLKPNDLQAMRRAYYGSVTHIDNQIGRILIALEESGEKDNTIIAFVSDHGDQLGEHNLLRKAYPYQGSIHVPFFIYDPMNNEKNGETIDDLVELRDIFPTLYNHVFKLELTGVDGIDVFKAGNEYIHGEHSFGKLSNHYIITKEWKFIWFDQTGEEQLFNLYKDPSEEVNVIEDNPVIVTKLRNILCGELDGREEGFVFNNKLSINKARVSTLQ